MLIGLARDTSPPWGPGKKAVLQKIRFIYIFQCNRIFVDGCSKRIQTHRTASVKVNDTSQHATVDRIESTVIYFEA